MITLPPFTPETLAARWGCSDETIRQRCRAPQGNAAAYVIVLVGVALAVWVLT